MCKNSENPPPDVFSRTYLPYKEAEEAEECVHEADVVGDAGDDSLLTVRTHGLHW